MSIKKSMRAALAGLAICGIATAAAAPAGAATPACGPHCIAVFSPELGSYASPKYVEHVFGGIAKVGQPTGLNAASRSDSSEDFINPHPGTVSDYYKLGLVSAAVNRHYGALTASQLEYAPRGKASGLCVSVAKSPFQGEPLSLQSCRIPGRTVWIIGTTLAPAAAAEHLFPIVSGASSDFAQPFAMSYPAHVNTAKQLPPIRLRHLVFTGSQHNTLANDQLWGVVEGPLK